jgi:hypothetical protein
MSIGKVTKGQLYFYNNYLEPKEPLWLALFPDKVFKDIAPMPIQITPRCLWRN